MNSTFNIKRFGLLLRRQWLDFGKIYLLSLVVLAGVLMGLYILNMPKLGDNIYYWGKTSRVRLDFRLPVFLILGFIFISIMASNYFSVMGQKAKAVAELMIPASTFEKTLAGIIYTTIISMAGYFAIFYFIDKAFVLYLDSLWQYQSMLNNFTDVMTQVRFSSIRQDLLTDGDSKYLFVTPVLITSIFLLGSIYFNRFHYIKTAVSTSIHYNYGLLCHN